MFTHWDEVESVTGLRLLIIESLRVANKRVLPLLGSHLPDSEYL